MLGPNRDPAAAAIIATSPEVLAAKAQDRLGEDQRVTAWCQKVEAERQARGAQPLFGR
jgi:hypothetical protein